MNRTANALLLATLLSAACQGQTNAGMNATDGGPIGGGDLVSPPPTLGQLMMTTIRDLNSDKYPAGTHVHVTGVMQGPMSASYAVLYDKGCLVELIAVQPDPAPTLKDGIAVRRIIRGVATGDMTVQDADCQRLVTDKLVRGDELVIEGTLLVENGIHSIDLGTIGTVTRTGTAQTLPQPVMVTSGQLASAPFGSALVPAFASANGALVTIPSVVSSEYHTPTLTFKVSATAADLNKTRISPEYLRMLNPAYVPPMDGALYKSVTGIVSTELGGTIVPRGTDDLAQ